MKRTIAYTLLLALLLSSISCGSETGSQTTDTTNGSTTAADTGKTRLDDLPEGLKFNGEKVTFLYREEVSNEFCVDEATGDVVDDAIYDSFRAVEERLNVDIEAVRRP